MLTGIGDRRTLQWYTTAELVIYGLVLNHSVVLIDNYLSRLSEVENPHVLQLGVDTFYYGITAGLQSDLLQPTLALIAQPRSADGRNSQRAS